MPKPFFI